MAVGEAGEAVARVPARDARAPVLVPAGDVNPILTYNTQPDLPPGGLLVRQAAWLAPARARLLRRIAIARRRSVLELGAGYGAVTPELVRRAGGKVVALDHAVKALRKETTPFMGAHRVGGDAGYLPFASATFDLVFCQWTLLWIPHLSATVAEVWRVLAPGGVLIALEPDYGGLIEYPPEIVSRDLWVAAIGRAGGDPRVGRKLPELLEQQHFELRVDLLNALQPPSLARFDFLRDLPLEDTARAQLTAIEQHATKLSGWSQVAHLPLFLITALKPQRE